MRISCGNVCSASHLRCPESAGNLSRQRTRRFRAAALPNCSHRFRTPQIPETIRCDPQGRVIAPPRSASHLRCPESAGNLSPQRTRRDCAAALPNCSHRFRTPQIPETIRCSTQGRVIAPPRSASHLRYPESAGNLSRQRTRRDCAAALPNCSHRFRTPQIRKRNFYRHHHRTFARSAICGALNLWAISVRRSHDKPHVHRLAPEMHGDAPR